MTVDLLPLDLELGSMPESTPEHGDAETPRLEAS
jgi:hypothetical protein